MPKHEKRHLAGGVSDLNFCVSTFSGTLGIARRWVETATVDDDLDANAAIFNEISSRTDFRNGNTSAGVVHSNEIFNIETELRSRKRQNLSLNVWGESKWLLIGLIGLPNHMRFAQTVLSHNETWQRKQQH